MVQTPMMDGAIAVISKAAGTDAETEKARMAKRHPLGRVGRPDEVARCVLALMDGAMAFMHGACVALDGGISACLLDPD